MSEDQNDDLFDDQPAKAEGEVKTEPEVEVKADKPEAKAEGEEGKEENTGEEKENTDGTPPTEEEGKIEKTDGKMIPEHRFKAAIKQVTDELNTAKEKLQKYEELPVPDKDSDPEGHELHIRMEASKTIMREMVSDYDDVIAKYPAMAKVNPYLDQAVAESKNPAKFAYDLVKRSIEMDELKTLRDSPEWKEFLESRKNNNNPEVSKETATTVSKSLTQGISKVPNLNRATDVGAKNKNVKQDDDDYLFADAKF